MAFELAGLVDVACPRCEYALEIDLVDIRAQSSRYCPACKTRLDLHDSDGSVYGSEQEIEAALVEAFDGLNLTIEF